jgi:adenine-specific DNA-methyltransferase
MAKQNYNKLELTWVGKGEEPKLEPRILIENPEYSYGDPKSENMLIHGDNLLALKALEQEFTGKIKCIYIDPPYNTGNAFEHYDDGVEHSIWLSLMSDRIKILHKLLSNDGTIWINLDDNEAHYCKVMCDEIFGRDNFVSTIIWHKKHTRSNDAKWLSDNHDFILCFAKSKVDWQRNLLPRDGEAKGYTNIDNDPRGVWASGPCHAKTPSEATYFEITTPSGRKVLPPAGTSWRFNKERFQELIDDNRIYFGADGSNIPRYKRFLTDVQDGLVPLTIWFKDEVGDNQEAKKEVKEFNSTDVFSTPKPERLIERIIHISSKPGDIILDSFLGSGTTAAVAHKMGRKWIGVELGEHAKTHCYPRLKAVVDGEQGGISKAVDWKGGDGFKFYNLAPSLLNEDKYGNWIISKEYNAQMLASAVAKQEGFKYEPDVHVYWKQGVSSEKDFIFTTTQFITAELTDKIHEEMQSGESLLIACKSYQEGCENRHANISIKKIPHMLMGRCEFGKDDYSFNIVNMPLDEEAVNWVEPEVSIEKTSKKSKNIDSIPGLFD